MFRAEDLVFLASRRILSGTEGAGASGGSSRPARGLPGYLRWPTVVTLLGRRRIGTLPREVPEVVFPHSRDEVGGSVVTGGLLAQALTASGHWQVTAVVNGSGVVADYHRTLGVRVVTLDAGRRRSHRPRPAGHHRLGRFLKRLRLILAAERYLRAHQVDLVHVNDESSALAWGLACARRKVPLVWQVHQQLPQRIDWLLLRLSAQVVFVADTNRLRFGTRRLPPSTTIHNGVDPQVFHPNGRAAGDSSADSSTVRIAFVNSLVDRKRPDWVVRAGTELLRRGRDIEVVLAGYDHNGIWDRLRWSAAGQVLGARLRYLGHIQDVPGLLRTVDVLVLPSERDQEAFPRIIVEALASSLPVVATATAGIPEAVTHGDNGLLVPPDDLAGFIQALDQLVGDPGLRRQMGRHGRDRALREFSLSGGVATHEAIYRRLLAERSL